MTVPLEFIRRVFAAMHACPHHTFQILTKRSVRLRAWREIDWPPNVWMGVSVEDSRVCRASMIYEESGRHSLSFVRTTDRFARRNGFDRYSLVIVGGNRDGAPTNENRMGFEDL